MNRIAPKKIFIIPYRNRENQKQEFLRHMTQHILNDDEMGSNEMGSNEMGSNGMGSNGMGSNGMGSNEIGSNEIYFAHQYDARPFNRGAMKNIGFLAMKLKYPHSYKNITFIFHDVDTYPATKGLIDYETTPGVVKHYYGYEFALGGIFAIKGGDFERSLGFPNFWGWGLEDNVIQERCLKLGLKIDRSMFYQMRDPRIIRAFDGFERIISKRDSVVYKRETPDNITSLTNIKWLVSNEYINITHFECGMNPNEQDYAMHDIRNGNKLRVPQGYDRRNWTLASIVKKPNPNLLKKG